MNNLVEIQSGKVVVNSKQVAEHFEKQHKDVLENIRTILAAENSATRFFTETSYDNRGKCYPMFLMNRDGFTLLAMGFTGQKALEWKLKYIEAFNDMEKKLQERILSQQKHIINDSAKSKIFTYRGRRVVTIKDIARVTNKRETVIQSNIRGKKAKLKEGTDFNVLRGNDLREFKRENNIMTNYYSTLTVIQLSGFKKLCKLWGIIPDETGVFLPPKFPASLPAPAKKADSVLTTKLDKQFIQAKRAVDALDVALDVYGKGHSLREGMGDALTLMLAHVTGMVTNLLRISDQLQPQPKA